MGFIPGGGWVAYETALENASNADDFKLRMQGICVDGGHFAPVYAVGGIWRTVEAGFRLGRRASGSVIPVLFPFLNPEPESRKPESLICRYR